ncbi:MAG TPA: tetratricopeptide repeat protein, partial [Prochlorococcus sp.]
MIDGALMPKASQAIPEALLAQAKTSDGKSLAIEDIERLTKEVKQAKEAGNYQKAIDILGQVLAIEKKELGPEHADVGGTLSWQGSIYTTLGLYEKAETHL